MKMEFSMEIEQPEFKTFLAKLDKGLDSVAAMLNKHCKGNLSIPAFIDF